MERSISGACDARSVRAGDESLRKRRAAARKQHSLHHHGAVCAVWTWVYMRECRHVYGHVCRHVCRYARHFGSCGSLDCLQAPCYNQSMCLGVFVDTGADMRVDMCDTYDICRQVCRRVCRHVSTCKVTSVFVRSTHPDATIFWFLHFVFSHCLLPGAINFSVVYFLLFCLLLVHFLSLLYFFSPFSFLGALSCFFLLFFKRNGVAGFSEIHRQHEAQHDAVCARMCAWAPLATMPHVAVTLARVLHMSCISAVCVL